MQVTEYSIAIVFQACRDFITSLSFRSTRASRTMWTWTWWNVCCSLDLDLWRTEQMRKAVFLTSHGTTETPAGWILLGEVVGCWNSLTLDLTNGNSNWFSTHHSSNNNPGDSTPLASGWFLILDDSKGHTITVCIPDWADIFSRAETQNDFKQDFSHDIQPTDRQNSTHLFDFNHSTMPPSSLQLRDTLLLQKKSNFVSVHASCVHLGSVSVSELAWSRRCGPKLASFHHSIIPSFRCFTLHFPLVFWSGKHETVKLIVHFLEAGPCPWPAKAQTSVEGVALGRAGTQTNKNRVF